MLNDIHTSRLQLLWNMPVFGGVDEPTLKFLLQSVPIISVSKGDYFFLEGDKALSMFVLEKGKVAVLKTREGRQCLLSHLQQGDCFGEMA